MCLEDQLKISEERCVCVLGWHHNKNVYILSVYFSNLCIRGVCLHLCVKYVYLRISSKSLICIHECICVSVCEAGV